VIITKILRSRKLRGGYAIYIDEVFAFDVGESVLMKFGLQPGNRIDEKTVEQLSSAEALDRAQKIAVNFISYRPRSLREVVNKLVSKGFSSELSNRVAGHLQAVNLLNDLEFARMFVRDKLRGKPIGKAMMRRKLIEKGIAPHTIERVIRETISEEDEQQAALKLLERKLRRADHRFAKLDAPRRRKRLLDYLLRRGFSSDVAVKTVRNASV